MNDEQRQERRHEFHSCDLGLFLLLSENDTEQALGIGAFYTRKTIDMTTL